MRICQPHWDRLRQALADRGIDHLGAKSGQQAMANIVTELEGRGDENDFDPLMACNNMIFAKGLEIVGFELMSPKEEGSERVPICSCAAYYEAGWINGPADAVLQEAIDKGLVVAKET